MGENWATNYRCENEYGVDFPSRKRKWREAVFPCRNSSDVVAIGTNDPPLSGSIRVLLKGQYGKAGL